MRSGADRRASHRRGVHRPTTARLAATKLLTSETQASLPAGSTVAASAYHSKSGVYNVRHLKNELSNTVPVGT